MPAHGRHTLYTYIYFFEFRINRMGVIQIVTQCYNVHKQADQKCFGIR